MAKRKTTVAGLLRAIEDQPLIGLRAAADLMGIRHPNFRRYRDEFTEIPVEGGASLYPVSEIQAKADELNAQRSRQAQAREEKRAAAEAKAST